MGNGSVMPPRVSRATSVSGTPSSAKPASSANFEEFDGVRGADGAEGDDWGTAPNSEARAPGRGERRRDSAMGDSFP